MDSELPRSYVMKYCIKGQVLPQQHSFLFVSIYNLPILIH